jgi:hypothetical protein
MQIAARLILTSRLRLDDFSPYGGFCASTNRRKAHFNTFLYNETSGISNLSMKYL